MWTTAKGFYWVTRQRAIKHTLSCHPLTVLNWWCIRQKDREYAKIVREKAKNAFSSRKLSESLCKDCKNKQPHPTPQASSPFLLPQKCLTGLKQNSPAAAYNFLSVLQGFSARSSQDMPRDTGTRQGRPLRGTLTMPGTLSTLREGGIYWTAPGGVVLWMTPSPSSPTGKEPPLS